MAAEEKEKLKDPPVGRHQVAFCGGPNELRPDMPVAKFKNFYVW